MKQKETACAVAWGREQFLWRKYKCGYGHETYKPLYLEKVTLR